jgi:hypothetical protein
LLDYRPDGIGPDIEDEAHSIEALLPMCQDGESERLQHCRECGKWFYQRARHQKFCKTKCRQKFASADDEFKKNRAKYMKDYRAMEKERAQKAKERARCEERRQKG